MARRRLRALLVNPESIGGVLARAGEDRFAPDRSPVPQHIWAAIVGPRVADRSQPMSLAKGVLMVRVATHVWADELSYLGEPIVARLREQHYPVKEIRFRVGPLVARMAPRPEFRVSRTLPAPVDLPGDMLQRLSDVADDELQNAIADAARSHLAWQSHTQVNEVAPNARAPRAAGKGIDLPAPTSGASPESGPGKFVKD